MKVREEAYGLSQGWEDLASVYGPPTDFLLVGGLGSLEIAAADPGHEATESGTCFLNGVFFAFFEEGVVALHSGAAFTDPFPGKLAVTNFFQAFRRTSNPAWMRAEVPPQRTACSPNRSVSVSSLKVV